MPFPIMYKTILVRRFIFSILAKLLQIHVFQHIYKRLVEFDLKFHFIKIYPCSSSSSSSSFFCTVAQELGFWKYLSYIISRPTLQDHFRVVFSVQHVLDPDTFFFFFEIFDLQQQNCQMSVTSRIKAAFPPHHSSV